MLGVFRGLLSGPTLAGGRRNLWLDWSPSMETWKLIPADSLVHLVVGINIETNQAPAMRSVVRTDHSSKATDNKNKDEKLRFPEDGME